MDKFNVAILGNGSSLYAVKNNIKCNYIQFSDDVSDINYKYYHHNNGTELLNKAKHMVFDDFQAFLDKIKASEIRLFITDGSDMKGYPSFNDSLKNPKSFVGRMLMLLYTCFVANKRINIDIVCLENVENNATLLKASLIATVIKEKLETEFVEFIENKCSFVCGAAFRNFAVDYESKTCILEKNSYLILNSKSNLDVFEENEALYYFQNGDNVHLSKTLIQAAYLFYYSMLRLESKEDILNNTIIRTCFAKAIYEEIAKEYLGNIALELSAKLFESLKDSLPCDTESVFCSYKENIAYILNFIDKNKTVAKNFFLLFAFLIICLIEDKAEGFKFLSKDMEAMSLSYAVLRDEELWGRALNIGDKTISTLEEAIRDIQNLGFVEAISFRK